ncbi:MAG TPA: TolC family protein [Allosphingosinicella sp.]|jgi:cobalt-zinc-cadmium efflux system outer membrane protein|uniref:TolC family protein n=1 Tax=Allosphingosinicella sp. TaxID=2823234 RepID=UPI002F2A3ED5
MPPSHRGRACGRTFIILAALASAGPLAAEPLTESQAIERALTQPELGALGDANRAEAEARVSGVRRFDNPEVEVSRESVSGDGRDETEWRLGVVQPIDISGRRSRLRAAARAELGAVEYDSARRRQERIGQVRRAYASCAAAIEKVRITAGFVERLREAERIVSARAGTGDAAVYDLRRLRVEARTAEARTAIQEGEVRAACATLAALTGDAEARPTASLALLAASLRPVASAANRPDLAAREQRLTAASEQVRAAERARLPDLAVGVGLLHVQSSGGSATGPAVSLGMRVPLFDGGGPAIAEARARLRAREAELGLARREVDAAVAAAEARSRAALEAAERAQSAAEDARRLGPIADAAYRGGEGGVVELVDAFRAARDAELEIVDHLERALLARVELDLARGAN